MAQVIALVNQKGGVGKTTTAVNLAEYLSQKGRMVLLVDLDPQANATSGIGLDRSQLVAGVYDAMTKRVPIARAIYKSPGIGYEIMPSSADLAGVAIELTGMSRREYFLAEVLNQVRSRYDYVIIDSPPSLDLLTINGLVSADGVIIPVQCEYYALEGLSRLLETISLIKKGLKPELKVIGALLTMYDKRNRLSRQVVKEVQNNFPGYVFESIIPRNVRLSEAPSFGKTILDFARLSKGARAYGNLAKELIKLELINQIN
jgi:chromosome partitioning protein